MDVIKVEKLKVLLDNREVSAVTSLTLTVSGEDMLVRGVLKMRDNGGGSFKKPKLKKVDVILENWRDRVIRLREIKDDTVTVVDNEALSEEVSEAFETSED